MGVLFIVCSSLLVVVDGNDGGDGSYAKGYDQSHKGDAQPLRASSSIVKVAVSNPHSDVVRYSHGCYLLYSWGLSLSLCVFIIAFRELFVKSFFTILHTFFSTA